MSRLFGSVVLTSLLAIACSDHAAPSSPSCSPGEMLACPCDNGKAGFQICADDGKRVAECQCDTFTVVPDASPSVGADAAPSSDATPSKDASPADAPNKEDTEGEMTCGISVLPEEQACFDENCMLECNACTRDPSCMSLLDCLSVSACSDQACVDACVAKHPDGLLNARGVNNCYSLNCYR